MLNKYIVLGIISGMTLLFTIPFANASYDSYGYDDYGYDHHGFDRYNYGSHRNYYKNYRNRVNVERVKHYDSDDYDSNVIHDYDTPKNHSKKHSSGRHGSMPEKISSGNIIKVDLGKLLWGAYDTQGNLVKSGPVSGGKSYCPDIRRGCRTITGTFTIYRKQGAGCKSSRFPLPRGGAPMPYCMHFHGGYALHGSNSVPGYNASHGCVRMHPEDAKWLNLNFVKVGSTRVNITY